MDYQKHYNKLINRAKNRLLEGYVEKHHIIPKCMNGSNDINNIIALTPEEHYVAHQLLVKMHPENYKLIYAAQMMTIGYKRKNNKFYGWLKKKQKELGFSKEHKQNMKGPKSEIHKKNISESRKGIKLTNEHKQNISKMLVGNTNGKGNKGKVVQEEVRQKISKSMQGEKNSFYGKKHSEESKQQQSDSHKGQIPWNKGLTKETDDRLLKLSKKLKREKVNE